MNIGKPIDDALDWLKDVAPNIKWAAIGFVAGLLTTAII